MSNNKKKILNIKAEKMDTYTIMAICPFCQKVNMHSTRIKNDVCQHFERWFILPIFNENNDFFEFGNLEDKK